MTLRVTLSFFVRATANFFEQNVAMKLSSMFLTTHCFQQRIESLDC